MTIHAIEHFGRAGQRRLCSAHLSFSARLAKISVVSETRSHCSNNCKLFSSPVLAIPTIVSYRAPVRQHRWRLPRERRPTFPIRSPGLTPRRSWGMRGVHDAL